MVHYFLRLLYIFFFQCRLEWGLVAPEWRDVNLKSMPVKIQEIEIPLALKSFGRNTFLVYCYGNKRVHVIFTKVYCGEGETGRKAKAVYVNLTIVALSTVLGSKAFQATGILFQGLESCYR